MRAPQRTRLSLGALARVSLAACKDFIGPDRDSVGEMHFTCSGAVNGEFEAEGRMTPRNFRTGTCAYAQRGDDGDGRA